MLKSLNGRFIIWGGVIVYIFLSCTPIAKKSFNYSSELEALSRLDLLPEFRSNCIVEQISSYDKTGGNDDGFNGTYSYIRKENNKLVIADLKEKYPERKIICVDTLCASVGEGFIVTEKKMPV